MKITPIYYSKSHLKPGGKIKRGSPLSTIKNHTPSFTSERLYRVVLERKTPNGEIKVPAYFSRLNDSDSCDFEAMNNIRSRIGNDNAGFCGKFISSHFLSAHNNNRNFYAIELEDETKPLQDRIVTLTEVDDYIAEIDMKRTIKVSLMQSLHNKRQNSAEALKGGGLACLYGITKLAKENNVSHIWLQSTENGFYDHIKFGEKSQTGEFTWYDLYQKDYESFLNRIEQKYCFNA